MTDASSSLILSGRKIDKNQWDYWPLVTNNKRKNCRYLALTGVY